MEPQPALNLALRVLGMKAPILLLTVLMVSCSIPETAQNAPESIQTPQGLSAHSQTIPTQQKPQRNPKARRSFHYSNPCPSTGKNSGACPGFEVDHIRPLKCGGKDSPENMQWLSKDQHKKKTASQAAICRRK